MLARRCQINCYLAAQRSSSAGSLAVPNPLPCNHLLACLQENPELVNIYLPATVTHLQVLLLAATASTRRRQLATAEKQLRQASTLLSCCRCLPSTAAQVALQLAQVLRLQAALKLPATYLLVPRSAAAAAAAAGTAAATPATSSAASASSGAVMLKGTELQLQRLAEAAELAGRALQLAVSDAGSSPALARSALLELAAAWLYSHQCGGAGVAGGLVSKVAAALQAAHVTAGQLRVLCLTNHQLQPVSVGGLPVWLVERLKSQEQLQSSLQQQTAQAAAAAAAAAGKPTQHRKKQQQLLTLSAASAAAAAAVTAAVPDTTLGRLAVCHYVRLLVTANDGSAGLQQQQLAAAQAVQLSPVMRAACPKLAADCCWSEVPVVGSMAAGGGKASVAAAASAGTVPEAADVPPGELRCSGLTLTL